jgi:hypothetical protein
MLISSIILGIFAAPRVYDIYAFFAACTFYVFLYLASGAILPFLSTTYSKWQMDSRSRGDGALKALKEMRRFRSYVCSTFNSIICVSIAIFMFSQGFLVSPSFVAAAGTRLACWCLSGYFVVDLFLVIRDAGDNKSDVVHHVFGLTLVSSFLVADAMLQYSIAPYGIWFFVSESSTIPLNTIYMLEKNGTGPAAASLYVLKRLFVLLFVIFRVLLMPIFAGVHLSFFSGIPYSVGFLFAAISCWSLSFLQFYFLRLIIQEVQITPRSCALCVVAPHSCSHALRYKSH